jgi:hypothetical protein
MVLLALSVKFWVWHDEHFSDEASSPQLGLPVKNDEVGMQQSQVVLPLKLTQPQVLVFTETFCARTEVVLLRG